MKEMDLLRAMNDIDDKYIEEAAPGEPVRKPVFRKYYKQFTAGAGIFAVLLFAFVWVRIGNYRMGSAAGGSMDSTAPQAVMESAAEPEEKSVDAGYGNVLTTGSAAMAFTYPDSFREYTVVTEEDTEEGFAVVYRNEQGEEGMRIIFSRMAQSFNANITQDDQPAEEAEELRTKDAVWTEGDWTYRIILSEEISAEEMKELMSEIHQ